MSFDAGSITSALGLDVSEFSSGMLQAQSVMSLFPSTVTNFMVNPILGVIGLLEQAATAAFSTFSKFTGVADHMNDLAQATGVGVEFLSAFGKAAETSGSNVDDLAEAFKFLGKHVSEALGGDKSSLASFERLGISAQQLKSADLGNLMLQVADGIKGMSAADRVASSMDVLGRSGTNLIQTLAQGRSAIEGQMDTYRQFGDVVTAESAASADAWNDALHDLGSAWDGAMMIITDAARESLLPVLQDSLNWVKSHGSEIRQFAQNIADGFRSALPAVMEFLNIVKELSKVLLSLGNLFGVSSSGWLDGLNAASGAASKATSPEVAGGTTPGSSSRGTTPSTVNVNVNVDHAEAASQISSKISPLIKEKLNDVYNGWETAAQQEVRRQNL